MIIDATLREGAQLYGAYLDLTTRLDLAKGLLDLGVEEIELGWVGQEGLEELVRALGIHRGRSVFSVWCPCRAEDVRAAAALGVERINIGLPVSDAHMRTRLGVNRTQALEMAGLGVNLARQLSTAEISLGLEDLSRADWSFALETAQTAVRRGATRIRLADSVGRLSPGETAEMVGFFRENLPCALAAHCHNDYGMATANAVAALDAGADYADASLMGMGERAGIAATEELAAYLTLERGSRAYGLGGLRELCDKAARAAGLPLGRTKPVVGQDIFACETGLHVQGLRLDPRTFEPFAPEALGAARKLGLGAKSGRAAVRSALEERGMSWPEALVAALTRTVRLCAGELGRPLSEGEFNELAAGTRAGSEC